MSFVKLVSNIGEFCFETNLPSENVNLKKTDFLPALIGYAGASSSCAFTALPRVESARQGYLATSAPQVTAAQRPPSAKRILQNRYTFQPTISRAPQSWA